MIVTKLSRWPSCWYATIVDGNMTRTGPTHFPATMSAGDVVEAIKAECDATVSPTIEIVG